MIHVVSGVAFRDGRVLLGKRPPGKLRPNLWELPGGKIEPGELAADALRREWREELGTPLLHVDPEIISTFTLELETTIQVDLHRVVIDVKPANYVHTELIWVTPLEAIQSMPCSPGLYLHFADLRAYMMRNNRWL